MDQIKSKTYSAQYPQGKGDHETDLISFGIQAIGTSPFNVYLQIVTVIFVVIQALATRLGLWENYPSAVHNQTKVPLLVP